MSCPSFDEIKMFALSLGWEDVGITEAKLTEETISFYEDWIDQKKHGDLAYMENQVRKDPQKFFTGAKTALIFISYYKQESMNPQKFPGLIASYARGRDYHHVHKKRLKKMITWLEEKIGEKNIAKGFTDSAPVMEKALAVQAGLGWFGKNTLFIHRKWGTFVLLSGLFLNFDVTEKKQNLSIHLPRCGSCTRCIDSCPTNAISPYQLDATLCLSYHTIESKKEIPKEIQEKNPGYLFGCDICQDVCPHNIRKEVSTSSYFQPESGIGTYLDQEKLEKIKEKPETLFGTPLQRRKVEGLLYTLKTLQEKKPD